MTSYRAAPRASVAQTSAFYTLTRSLRTGVRFTATCIACPALSRGRRKGIVQIDPSQGNHDLEDVAASAKDGERHPLSETSSPWAVEVVARPVSESR